MDVLAEVRLIKRDSYAENHNVGDSIFDKFKLPLSSDEELDNFEDYLKNDSNFMNAVCIL